MATQITSTQKVNVSVTATDVHGNPAPIENVGWDVSDKSILELRAGSNVGENQAEVFAVGPVGTAQVQVKADVQIGEGQKEKTGTLDIEVVASEAAIIQVTAGTPEEIAGGGGPGSATGETQTPPGARGPGYPRSG